jgi:restriction endonuclease
MAVVLEIQELIGESEQKLRTGYFNVVEFLEAVGDLLQSACSNGAECDSGSDSARVRGEQAYRSAAEFLVKCRFRGAAEELLIRWWNELGARQLTEPRHIYRAMTAFTLCQLYLTDGDSGAALRWALLTHADDRLHEHSEGGGAGMQYLRTILGANQADLEAINRIADENLTIVSSGNAAQSRAAWFAEDVVVRLALEGVLVAHLFAKPSSKPEFPISQPYLVTLLRTVDAQDISAADKGKALESLASYLFLLIPGWFPSRNVLDQDAVFESDVLVSNLNPEGNLAAELLGRHFLVECKNWKNRVGVAEIGYFFHRMRLTHCSFGVLMAKNNVTGKAEKDNAGRGVIRRTFHEDRNICIVLDKDDLEKLESGVMTFWTMLVDQMQRFRFGEAR